MYLICYGTRPEFIKVLPLINEFTKTGVPFKTLFTGQHKDLIKNFKDYYSKPTFALKNVMQHNQSLNSLISNIILKTDEILKKDNFKVIVQGDSATSYAAALAAFNRKKEVIHIEAGLRTKNLKSPFPEEGNRVMISHIANIHFCPTKNSVENLNSEGINKNVFQVGNTIVDSYKFILDNFQPSRKIDSFINKLDNYLLVTLHRRENRESYFKKIWNQLNQIAKDKNIIYITHPSVPDSSKYLNNLINIFPPLNYAEMIYLIKNSSGVISDSGGIQEEVVCANKKILICRDTTERPETIEYGFGKLVGSEIIENINFLNNKLDLNNRRNPYGNNVSKKIVKVLNKFY